MVVAVGIRVLHEHRLRATWKGFANEKGFVLVDSFVSFSREQEVSNRLVRAGYKPWSHIYGSQISPNTDRSNDMVLDDRICCLNDYRLMGQRGNIHFTFYRNRLGQISFFPGKSDESEQGIASNEVVNACLDMIEMGDNVWRDKRLMDELNDYVRHFKW